MRGTVTTGDGVASSFVDAAQEVLAVPLSFRSFPGTLNLRGVDGVEALDGVFVDDEAVATGDCEGVRLQPCSVGGVRAAVVTPFVPGYPDEKTEVLAPVRLRSLFGLDDGDSVRLSAPEDRWHPDGPRADPTALDGDPGFDAVVFDLDGTLVDLGVDWEAVRDELDALLGAYLPGPVSRQLDVDLAAVAREHDRYDEFVELLAEYELAGAERASPAPALDVLSTLDCPVGVCTKNARAAAERALSLFGVRDEVDAVVARETVREQKPDPRPLGRCFELLGVDPADGAFVGDDPSDCETAVRAGARFLHPDQLSR